MNGSVDDLVTEILGLSLRDFILLQRRLRESLGGEGPELVGVPAEPKPPPLKPGEAAADPEHWDPA